LFNSRRDTIQSLPPNLLSFPEAVEDELACLRP
jgi:hypothetical protein